MTWVQLVREWYRIKDLTGVADASFIGGAGAGKVALIAVGHKQIRR